MLIDLDLAGAEWICTAYLAQEPAMLEVVKSGKSPHILTACKMFGVTEDVAYRDYKLTDELTSPEEIVATRKQHIPELDFVRDLPRTASMRNAAKRANFGLNYREGYKTFALKNEMEERDAKRIVHLYRDVAYPGLKDWYKSTDDEVKRTRTLTNCFGRKIYFMGQLDDETFRAATAAVPQSTIVDITNQTMPKIMEDDSDEFKPCELREQVHDALFLDYLSVDYGAMAVCVHRVATDYMAPDLCYSGQRFRLKVGVKVGYDWGHLHEIEQAAVEEGGERLAEALKEVAECGT